MKLVLGFCSVYAFVCICIGKSATHKISELPKKLLNASVGIQVSLLTHCGNAGSRRTTFLMSSYDLSSFNPLSTFHPVPS